VAASPISDELGALEQARSRLEAALSDDENWRALTQPGKDEDSAEARAARQARNTRLELALADNAHYQAWKHVNGAIDALRTRSLAQPQAAESFVRPASTGEAARGADDLPENIATLLRDATPQSVQQVDEPVAPAAGAQSPSGRAGLVERLEQLEDGQAAAAAESAVRPGVEASPDVQGQASKQERKAKSGPADPPEATVTFVVREARAPLPPSAELQSDLGAEPDSALIDRLRSLEEKPVPPGETYSPSKVSGEEAEVTIVSAEDLKQRRDAEERGDIVRRFRKALSGD